MSECAGITSGAPEQFRINFDARIYSLEILQRAALKFTRLASFDFRPRGGHEVDVLVSSVPSLTLEPNQFTASYRAEVLDQHLRATVAKETEVERNLILAYAFSNTKLIATS